MQEILFFDTETTGNTEHDRLCQLGVKVRGVAEPLVRALYKPDCPISYESMAIHHITEAMVADRPRFRESPEYESIKARFENPHTIAVAHNARFDVGMFAHEGIVPAHVICTMKVARALDTAGTLPNHRLQYLRYRLNIEVQDALAHDAWGDVLVLEGLFERQLAKLIELHGSEEAALTEMIAISARPSLIRSFSFGKYLGKDVADVAKQDSDYLRWLLAQKQKEPADQEDWIYTLTEALRT